MQGWVDNIKYERYDDYRDLMIQDFILRRDVYKEVFFRTYFRIADVTHPEGYRLLTEDANIFTSSANVFCISSSDISSDEDPRLNVISGICIQIENHIRSGNNEYSLIFIQEPPEGRVAEVKRWIKVLKGWVNEDHIILDLILPEEPYELMLLHDAFRSIRMGRYE